MPLTFGLLQSARIAWTDARNFTSVSMPNRCLFGPQPQSHDPRQMPPLCRECLDRGIHWRTKVLIRFGTSPTGITAIIFRALASTADTDLAPEFEM